MRQSFLNIDLDFRYAEVRRSAGRVYVCFYMRNRESNVMERHRIYVNRQSSIEKNIRMANLMAEKINRKLEAGINPFISFEMQKQLTPVLRAIEFSVTYKSSYLRPKALSDYRSRISKLTAWISEKKLDRLEIAEFSEHHATAFMNDLLMIKGLKGRTYNNHLTLYRSIFNLLQKQTFIKDNPFRAVDFIPEVSKQRQPFSEAELKQYSNYLKQYDYDFYIISMYCYYCALRPNEISNLKVKHINLAKQCIDVPGAIAKNKHDRHPPINITFFNHLKGYIENTPANFYLCSKGMKPGETKLAPTRIAEHFRKIANKLNFSKELQFYSLKDTCAERLIEAGYDVRVIRDLFDHSDISITDNYLRGRVNKNFEKLKASFPEF